MDGPGDQLMTHAPRKDTPDDAYELVAGRTGQSLPHKFTLDCAESKRAKVLNAGRAVEGQQWHKGKRDAAEGRCRGAVGFAVVLLGVGDVSGQKFRNGQVRDRDRQGPSGGEPFGDGTVISLPRFLGAKDPKINSFSRKLDERAVAGGRGLLAVNGKFGDVGG